MAAQLIALIVSRGILLVATVLVARTAGLAAYGVLALGLVVFQAGLFLRDAGLGQAVIILGGREPGVARPAFLLVTGIGVALALLMAAVADPLVALLGIDGAAGPIRILALAFGIGSLGIVSSANLERMLRFRARASVEIVSYIALGATTIGLVNAGAGAVSLAWGYVAQAVVQSGLALVLAPPRARGESTGGLGHFLRYSSQLWAAAALSYVAANLDNALVARLGGASALGLYALSYTIATTVTMSLAQVVNRVALPYYGRQGEPRQAGETLASVAPLALALCAAPATLSVFLAPEIGRIALGADAPVGPLIVLAVYAVGRALGMTLGTAFSGAGQVRVVVRGSAVNVALMAIGIPAVYPAFGPTGTAVVVLVAMTVGCAYMLAHLDRNWHLDRAIVVAALGLGAWFLVAAAVVAVGVPLAPRAALGAVGAVLLLVWAARTAGLTTASLFPRSA